VDDIDRVINYELPHEPEVYVHRIGRTARAGKKGVAVSFCDPTEVKQLRDIERLIRSRVPVDGDHRFHSTVASQSRDALEPARAGGRSGRKNGQSYRGSRSGPRSGPGGSRGAGSGGRYAPGKSREQQKRRSR
jgi:ATP-dependent RNA helicase RhlE